MWMRHIWGVSQWGVSNIQMRHVKHICDMPHYNKACYRCEWGIYEACHNEACQIYKWSVLNTFVACLRRTKQVTDVNAAYMRHVTMRRVEYTNKACWIHMWHASEEQSKSRMWTGYIWGMSQSGVLNIQTRRVEYICDMPHKNQACHRYEWGISRIWMPHVTHMNEAC